MWLVGLPRLITHLRMQQHAALAMRVAVHMHSEPLGRDDFVAMVHHGLSAVGAKDFGGGETVIQSRRWK